MTCSAGSIPRFFGPFYGNTWGWALVVCAVLADLISPDFCAAIQLHQGTEGIIVHQVGHLFFLLSMVVLIFIITGRQLNTEHGWKLIQLSAILFVLWNLDTVLAHFFDNQVRAVTVQELSLWEVKISTLSGSEFMALFYHSLKLDHLLCVPALFFFYRGLSSLLAKERFQKSKQEARDEKTAMDDRQGHYKGGEP